MNNVVNVTYRTSNGIEYPFQIDALRIKETNFHKWNYVPNALTRRFGDWLLRFDKEAATYEAMLYAYGSRTERRDFLDRLHKAFTRKGSVVTRWMICLTILAMRYTCSTTPRMLQ